MGGCVAHHAAADGGRGNGMDLGPNNRSMAAMADIGNSRVVAAGRRCFRHFKWCVPVVGGGHDQRATAAAVALAASSLRYKKRAGNRGYAFGIKAVVQLVGHDQ